MQLENIFLIGFMTAGKSTVGLKLANLLEGQFVDTDNAIEQRLHMSIKSIFAHYGEEYFRSCETAVLQELCNITTSSPLHACSYESSSAVLAYRIIATGGGMVGRVQNREIMHQHGTVVYLSAPWADICRRLHRVPNRPLAHNVETGRLKLLWQKRLPLYQNADIIIETANLSPCAIAQKIASYLIP